MNIFLFDMDGVLLQAGGYHRALQETVRIVAAERGLGEVWLSSQDIAAYESAGVTSEWDSSAISIAWLLAARQQGQVVSFPSLAQKLAEPELAELAPLQRAEKLLLDDGHALTAPLREELRALLRHARSIEYSRTHRVFQELVLGSDEFTRTYHLPAELATISYLVTYDSTNFTPALAKALRDWLATPDHAAAILTSRPSLPPPGSGTFSTPEAELGLQLIGFAELPVAGWGGLCWLGEQTHTDPQASLKPSPVHALAALALALGEQPAVAFAHAWKAVQGGALPQVFNRLAGAHIVVFEDTRGGLLSVRTAWEILVEAGVVAEVQLVGVTVEPVKVAALRDIGADVYDSLPAALIPFLTF